MKGWNGEMESVFSPTPSNVSHLLQVQFFGRSTKALFILRGTSTMLSLCRTSPKMAYRKSYLRMAVITSTKPR